MPLGHMLVKGKRTRESPNGKLGLIAQSISPASGQACSLSAYNDFNTMLRMEIERVVCDLHLDVSHPV